VKKPEATKIPAKTKVEPMRKSTAIGKIDPVKMPESGVAALKPKKPFNPAKFFAEVRQEARRITWTSRKEVWITTVMVMIMVVLASLFLWLVDIFFGWLLSLLQTGLHG
jgi:preprotein translocase subunit SecE